MHASIVNDAGRLAEAQVVIQDRPGFGEAFAAVQFIDRDTELDLIGAANPVEFAHALQILSSRVMTLARAHARENGRCVHCGKPAEARMGEDPVCHEHLTVDTEEALY